VGLSGSVSYADGPEHTSRATGFGQALSSRSSSDVTGAVQLAAPYDTGVVKLTPAAGVLVSDLSNGAFIETDAASAAFAVTGSAYRLVDVAPYAQVGLSHAYTSGDGMVVTPDLVAGYRYDSNPDGGPLTLTARDGSAFTDNGLQLDHASLLLGASLTAHKGAWTAYVKYRAQVSGDWNDQTFEAGVRVAF
jgi:hypothetical protein